MDWLRHIGDVLGSAYQGGGKDVVNVLLGGGIAFGVARWQMARQLEDAKEARKDERAAAKRARDEERVQAAAQREEERQSRMRDEVYTELTRLGTELLSPSPHSFGDLDGINWRLYGAESRVAAIVMRCDELNIYPGLAKTFAAYIKWRPDRSSPLDLNSMQKIEQFNKELRVLTWLVHIWAAFPMVAERMVQGGKAADFDEVSRGGSNSTWRDVAPDMPPPHTFTTGEEI